MLPESWWKQSCLWKQWHSYWEEWFHMRECVLTLFKWFQTHSSPYRLYASAWAASTHVHESICTEIHTQHTFTHSHPLPAPCSHTQSLDILAVRAPVICSTLVFCSNITCHWLVMAFGIKDQETVVAADVNPAALPPLCLSLTQRSEA